MSVTEVVMPSMGADMTEGSIARWLKQQGDEVQRGDILAEVETDKAVVEMEAYGSGVLRKVLVDEGVTVPVGQVIGIIADPDEAIPEIEGSGGASGAEPAAAAAEAEETPAATARPAAPPAPSEAPAGEGRIKASPVARKLAGEKGIDLSTLTGSGPGGRIVKADVEAVAASGPAAAATAAGPPTPAPAPQPTAFAAEDIPLTNMRKAIARTVVRSKTDQPDFWVSVSIDMTEAMALRKQINDALEPEGARVSVNDMIVKATVMAIERHPKWNTYFDGDVLRANPHINIGIAIALDQGLMVPALLTCEGKSLKQLAAAARDLGQRARSGGLSQQQLNGGTFSISNLGMYGVDEFSAILVPPQPGILAVGAVMKKPVVRNDEVRVAEILRATLTVDHRVADGAEAAVFIHEIRNALENPMSLLL